jgi:hypothetical protein
VIKAFNFTSKYISKNMTIYLTEENKTLIDKLQRFLNGDYNVTYIFLERQIIKHCID